MSTFTGHPLPAGSLQGVLDCTQNGIMIYQSRRDEQGQIFDFELVSLNKWAKAELGYTPSEPIGRTLLDLFAAAAQPTIFDRYRQVVESGKAAQFEMPYVRPTEQQSRWLAVSLVQLEDGLVMSYHDSTERRQTDIYDQALNATQTGIVLMQVIRDSATGRVMDLQTVLANDRGAAFSGFSREDLLGQSLLHIYQTEPALSFCRRLIEVAETGKSLQLEQYMPAESQWVEVAVRRYSPEGIMVTYNDISHAKTVELARQEQTSLLGNVTDTVQSAIMLCQAIRDEQDAIVDFQIILCNEVCSRLTGYTREELISKTVLGLFDHQATFFEHYKQVVETGLPSRIEHYRPSHDVWLDTSVSKLGDGVVVSLSDITSLKKNMMAHERTTAMLKSVLTHSPTGIIAFEAVRDGEGQITAFQHLSINEPIGSEGEGSAGTSLLDAFLAQPDAPFFNRYVEVVERAQPQRFEHHQIHQQTDSWFDVFLIKHNDGLIMTFLDITPVKQLQLAYREQAELLDRVTNAGRYALILNEAIREGDEIVDFRPTLFNETLQDWTGVTGEQLQTLTLQQAYPPLKSAGLFDRLVAVIDSGQPQQFTLAPQTFMGDRWLDITLSKLGDGVVLVGIETTQQHQYQQELEQRNQDLRYSNDNLQQFAYVASHDLQEPLRKIQSFGEILHQQYGASLNETGVDMIQRMQQAARRMSDLIQDLLTYSRISTKQAPFQRIALNALLNEVLGDLEIAVQEKAARITIDPLPEVLGDRLQLGQLFQNLLSNALKFNRPGEPSVIHVSARSVHGQTIRSAAPADQSRRFVEIAVADDGIGFDEKYLDRIFQVFQRLHGKSQYSGTGIGLAICKKVIENHKGYIDASSQPNAGATFRIYLPL